MIRQFFQQSGTALLCHSALTHALHSIQLKHLSNCYIELSFITYLLSLLLFCSLNQSGKVRAKVQRGIEVIRALGNHGLHVKLLLYLAHTFADKVNLHLSFTAILSCLCHVPNFSCCRKVRSGVLRSCQDGVNPFLSIG